MVSPAEITFFVCAAVTSYVYAGYPLLLATGILGRKTPVLRRRVLPSVSVVIPAHNEEQIIGEKLHNTVELSYPREFLQIVVGSDGSTDATAEIVRQFNNVLLYESSSQVGKSSIQNEAVMRSSGEILVFTDADCLLKPDALINLVANFADPAVGLVTARPSYTNAEENDITRNEGLYLRYESWIREQESVRGLLAVASGSLFAIRRSLWTPLAADLGDDFVLPLWVTLRGYRNVLEHQAGVRTQLSQNRLRLMFAMKRRIISKDMLGLMRNISVLNPFRTGRMALSLLSHKLLRWFVPFFLLGMLLANLLLTTTWSRVTLALQLGFYFFAISGAFLEARIRKTTWLVPAFFCAVNLGAALAVIQCALGRTSGRWKPARQDPIRITQ